MSAFADLGVGQRAVEGRSTNCAIAGRDVVDDHRAGDVDAELKCSGITPDAT